MFKRVLAFALAGCLIIESAPLKTYASTSQAETVSENSVSENDISENDMEETSEIETGVETETQTGDDSVSEGKASTEEETTVEDETIMEESAPVDENTSEMENESAEVPSEEQTFVEEETESILEEESVQEVNVSEDDVLTLRYGQVNTISLKAYNDETYDDYPQWYSFTAPSDGFYNFVAAALPENYEYTTYLQLYANLDGFSIRSDNVASYSGLSLRTNEMKQGETIYIKAYTYERQDVTFNVSVEQIPVYNMEKQQDGSYYTETSDFTLTANVEAGYKNIRGNAVIEAKGEETLTLSYLNMVTNRIGDDYENENGTYLGSGIKYTPRFNNSANSDTEYGVYFVLEDSYESPIAIFDGDILLKTKTSSNPLEIHEVTSTIDTITFDMELFNTYYCYYTPVDGSAATKYLYVSSGWTATTFGSLQPGKEYRFEFADANGHQVYETTASTKSDETAVVYDVTLTDNGTKLTVSADVSNFTHSANYVYLCYEFTDALGDTQRGSNDITVSDVEAVDGAKSFQIEAPFANPAFLAGTTYDVKVWLRIGNTILKEEVKTVTAPASTIVAEDVTFTVTPSEEIAGEVVYNLQINNLPGAVSARLYYRQKGNEENYTSYTTFNVTNTEAHSGYVTNLQAGTSYEFVMMVDGIKKEADAELGLATTKLITVGEDVINPFDFVRTFKIETTDEYAENYYVKLYYWTENNQYEQFSGYIELNAGNNYQEEYKTALSGKKLQPDTEYKFKWTVSTSYYGLAEYVVYETLRTEKLNLTMESTSSLYNEQEYEVTIDAEDMANFENASFYLYAYIREQGVGSYHQAASAYLSKSYDWSSEISFSGLKEKTTYEVSVRDESGQEYSAFSFTTPEDMRTIEVTEVKSSLHSVNLKYTVSGTSASSGYVFCYIKEKGTEDPWDYVSYNHYYESKLSSSFGINYYQDKELKDGTTYEYKLGFGGDSDTSLEELQKVVTGEFSTATDNRRLTAGASVGYASAKLSATYTGNDYYIGAYFYFFYKEKDAKDWIKCSGGAYSNNVSASDSKDITGLTAGTTYDYVVVLSDSYECDSPDKVEVEQRKVVGQFTTKKNGYNVEFKVDEEKLTHNKATVIVAAKGSEEDAYVQVDLILSDGQTQTVTLKQSSDYTKDVTFTGLRGDKEYTITKAIFSVTENNQLVTIGEQTCDCKFTTKKAEIPTSITIEEEITLNAVYAGKRMDGFSSAVLTAGVQPETAADDFVWSSSDLKVATVIDGIVFAQGAGTAVITVASVYDENVKASCNVTVKNYAIGYTDEKGEIQVLNSAKSFSVYKNSTLENFGYYEIDAEGKATALSDYDVTPFREEIVSWENGTFTAVGVGKTRVDFEKDGVKAAIYVNVTAAGRGFGIVDFEEMNDGSYPAIREADGSYTLVHFNGITYVAVGEITPKQKFNANDFTWSISDSTIATVSDKGVITPLKQGKVVLTVTPQKYSADTPYIQKEVKVSLNIKGLPVSEDNIVEHALTNIATKLSDVKLEDGWSWKYPDTPLVTNNVNVDNHYYFEAVYTGEAGYPIEKTIEVRMGKITGVYAFENNDDHNGILEVGGKDSISLSVKPITQGEVHSSDYEVEILDDNDGLKVTKSNGAYKVTAQKAGKYTLKVVVKATEDKSVLANSTYTITAVEEKQVASIEFTTDTEGVTINGNTVIFDTVEAKKNFDLKAAVKDRYGNTIDTVLQWKTTDKAVATVATAKGDTHSASITAKGEGHTVIMVTAKDQAKYQVELDIEIQNHAPRVDTNKATVNIAYSYNSGGGRSLASAIGLVEIVPVYSEYISDVQILDAEGEKVEENLVIDSYSGYKYLVKPAKDEIPTGTYDCTLRVTTNGDKSYDYKLKVSVINKAPTVSAKMNGKINLFFTTTSGRVDFKISDNARVEAVTWEDESEGVNNGFAMSGAYYTSGGKLKSYANVTQQEGLQVVDGSLKEDAVAKGTLTVKLYGYRKLVSINNFAVKYNYKKPNLVTRSASSNIVPTAGLDDNNFFLYDNTNKHYVYYTTVKPSYYYYFNEIMCEEEDAKITTISGSSRIDYSYSGKENSKKLVMTLDSLVWREPVQVTHTVKAIKPKAYLSSSVLTYNTNAKATLSTYVYLKNAKSIACADIVVKGADAKAQKLLDDDLFVITTSGGVSNQIKVAQSEATLMETSIPAGTYSYKATPYYANPETGEKVAMNTLTFKIKVIDKPVTAKVTPKGTLDLANGSSHYVETKKNSVWIDPKFSNLTNGYSMEDYKLIGEYSEYFDYGYSYGHYYLTIDYDAVGKLKAGQVYKLAVEYTFRTTEGEEFTVTSNTFNIKPKQSKPKVTVGNNNQTLYAAADNMSRTYYLYVPSYYSIESAYGSLDCNKDGKADITVNGYGGSSVRVSIADRDAVVATTSGKTYTVPVTVQVRGRDGISKDATVKIKVKVKR